jgi:hypothetical protein
MTRAVSFCARNILRAMMGVFIPSWVIIAVVVIMIFYSCGGRVETLLAPLGIAPKTADAVELSMRQQMFAR